MRIVSYLIHQTNEISAESSFDCKIYFALYFLSPNDITRSTADEKQLNHFITFNNIQIEEKSVFLDKI